MTFIDRVHRPAALSVPTPLRRRSSIMRSPHDLLKRAAEAGLKGTLAEPVSPHGLRAGFVTTAYRNGVPDKE